MWVSHSQLYQLSQISNVYLDSKENKNYENFLDEKYKSVISCRRVPSNCNKKSCDKKYKKCKRTSDHKLFSLPRLYSRKQCKSVKKKGFTQRSSCAAYE